MSSFLYLYITPVFPFSVLMKEWAVVRPGEGIECRLRAGSWKRNSLPEDQASDQIDRARGIGMAS